MQSAIEGYNSPTGCSRTERTGVAGSIKYACVFLGVFGWQHYIECGDATTIEGETDCIARESFNLGNVSELRWDGLQRICKANDVCDGSPAKYLSPVRPEHSLRCVKNDR